MTYYPYDPWYPSRRSRGNIHYQPWYGNYPPQPQVEDKLAQTDQKLKDKGISMDGDVVIYDKSSDGHLKEMLKDIKHKLESIEKDIGDIKRDVSDIKREVKDMHDTLDTVKKDVKEMKDKTENMERDRCY